MFTKVMASLCNLEMINIDLGNPGDKSSLPKRIKKAFESARKSNKPTMIFFDEMDKVLPNVSEEYYSDHSKAILAQLLTLIDGMNSNKNFIFVHLYFASLCFIIRESIIFLIQKFLSDIQSERTSSRNPFP